MSLTESYIFYTFKQGDQEANFDKGKVEGDIFYVEKNQQLATVLRGSSTSTYHQLDSDDLSVQRY